MMPDRETTTFILEVGPRAALWAETLQRDMRWWEHVTRELRRG